MHCKIAKSFTLIILISCFPILGCKKEKSRICELYDSDVEYAIGMIQSIDTSPFKATYKYAYSINGTNYSEKEKAYGIGQKDETLIGKEFVVVYSLGNPANSDLNTDFRIETEQDFDNFKSNHVGGPPAPDFPNNCD